MKGKIYILFLASIFLTSCNEDYSEIIVANDNLNSDKIELGRKLFFEKKLSNPEGQSCASCHAPETGFSDPNHSNISEGVIKSLFGNRNAPALSYNVLAPEMFFNNINNTYIGGMFLDGRATNLEAQVLGPLLNPIEMNNSSKAMLISKIKNLDYYSEFEKLYGKVENDDALLFQITNAITTFEKSRIVNTFTSKFDYYSRGMVSFTEDEKAGLALFIGKANCASCHVVEEDERNGKVLFTDFSYDNLGVPKNMNNPFYNMSADINSDGANFIDLGLGKTIKNNEHNGKFKVPTLRNIAVSAPYFHNGVFSTLEEVIQFYNKRDIENKWTPEYASNINKTELGNLKLTPNEERQIKIFLETLTDHYRK